MKLHDNYKPRMGIFRLEVLDQDKNVLEVFEEENLIVLTGRTSVRTNMFDTTSGNDNRITKIAVGTNGAGTTPEDSDLNNKSFGVVLDVEYPDNYSARVVWELGYGEANGKTITEYGLFTENETLFARKVRPPITKDSFIALRGQWTILF